ncbi:MAG: hypothetical protein HKP58_06020, partial [Desulfatitalea sp.]|nr:hypothetical protein [Desulfatitalea sp.]NNJ99952.1 hypothetical protein [Desulfatitalea sp.]
MAITTGGDSTLAYEPSLCKNPTATSRTRHIGGLMEITNTQTTVHLFTAGKRIASIKSSQTANT